MIDSEKDLRRGYVKNKHRFLACICGWSGGVEIDLRRWRDAVISYLCGSTFKRTVLKINFQILNIQRLIEPMEMSVIS